MRKWARRIRGAIGMGLTWAAAGGLAGFLMASLSPFNPDLPFGLLFAGLGFITGVLFSVILVVLSGNRRFDRMSLSRFAGLGAASGFLLSGTFAVAAMLRGQSFWGDFLLFGPALIIAGAASATGTLALARRAERLRLRGPNGEAEAPQLPP